MREHPVDCVTELIRRDADIRELLAGEALQVADRRPAQLVVSKRSDDVSQGKHVAAPTVCTVIIYRMSE